MGEEMAAKKKAKKKADDSDSDSDDDSDSDEPKKFSIFDEPTGMDEPIYMYMYDKVKNRRSCVKQREAEVEQRRQQEALLKFCKLKQQRAQREGKKKSMDSDYRDSDNNDSDDSPRMKNNKPRSRFMLSTDSDSDSGKEEDRKGKK